MPDMKIKLGLSDGISVGKFGITGGGAAEAGGDSIGDALRAAAKAYWKMDEASGNRLDSTGNGHNFVSGGNPSQAAGKINNALAYNTVALGEYAVCPSHSNLGGGDGSNWMACGWAYFNNFDDTQATLLAKSRDVGIEYIVFRKTVVGNPVLALEVGGGAVVTVEATSVVLSVGTWYFWMAWQDWNSGTVNLRINNGTIHSLSISASDNTYDPLANILIGEQYEPDPDPDGGYGLNGRIDEMGFFKPSESLATWLTNKHDYLYNSGAGRTLYP